MLTFYIFLIIFFIGKIDVFPVDDEILVSKLPTKQAGGQRFTLQKKRFVLKMLQQKRNLVRVNYYLAKTKEN